MTTGSNLYIYCIAYKHDEEPEIKITGHHGEPVFGVVHHNHIAFVSKTNVTHLDPTFENLSCHEQVISSLMEQYNVLPMSFSTVSESKENLHAMMEKYYDQFADNLQKTDGKVELGIKVFYKLNFMTEDKNNREEYNNPKNYMMNRYKRYLEQKEQIDKIMSCIDQFHQKLLAVSCESCSSKPIKNNLIFNASYLVLKNRKHEFEVLVDEGIRQYPAYRIKYSGPWPAYHFVKIAREGAADE